MFYLNIDIQQIVASMSIYVEVHAGKNFFHRVHVHFKDHCIIVGTLFHCVNLIVGK